MSKVVFVWSCGYVALVDTVKLCRYSGRRPCWVGLVQGSDVNLNMSRRIAGKKAIEDGGHVIMLDSVEGALEGLFDALGGEEGKVIKGLVNCSGNLQESLRGWG